MSEPKNVGHTLYRETEAAKTLRAQLADIIAGDDEFAGDVVEAETNLNEAIEAAVQMLADDMAAIKGINDYIEKFTVRKERIKQRIEHMRTALGVALEQAGKKRFDHPAVTLSLRAVAPAVVVNEEGDIPAVYWEPQPPKLNKRALLKALKEHDKIPGATLSNGGTSLALKWS
jgi:hypothetical protein